MRRIEPVALVFILTFVFLGGCPEPKPREEPVVGPRDEASERVNESPPSSRPAPTSDEQSQKGTSPETRDQVDPDGVIRRGVAVADEEALTLSALLEQADALNGETVTVTGTIDRVCAKKGCWMALRDDEGGPTVRITSKGYKYFVPMSAVGQRATAKGEVAVRALDEATARHYAEDAAQAGEAPGEIRVGREVTLASIGLEIRK